MGTDFRIYKHLQVVVVGRYIDNHYPFGHFDLDGSQSDTRRCIHGFRHIIHQFLDFGANHIHRFGLLPQTRVGIN